MSVVRASCFAFAMFRFASGVVALVPHGRFFFPTQTRALCSSAGLFTEYAETKSEHEKKNKIALDMLKATTIAKNLAAAHEALQVLSDWNTSKKLSFKSEIENTEDFKSFSAMVEEAARSHNHLMLFKTYEKLMKLGVNESSYLIKSLGTELLWRMKKVSFSTLMSILIFHLQYQETEMQKKIVKEALDSIQRRWVEVTSAKDISDIYLHVSAFSPEFLGRVDDRAVELVGGMQADELSRIFCALGQVKRRVTPLLRAIAFHLSRKDERLTAQHCSNVLFAANSLNFSDPGLLEKLSRDLLPEIAGIEKATIISTILTCMGRLRWRQTDLLELLCDWVQKNIDQCRVTDFVALFMTLSTVNYAPVNIDSLFKSVLPRITVESVSNDVLWLDFVWSLTILGLVDSQLLGTVLDSAFFNRLTNAMVDLRTGIKLKLQNINAAARILFPSYSGPFLDVTHMKDIIMTETRSELIFKRHMKATFRNFLPPPRYYIEDVQTPLGFQVDIELAVDKNGDPIPIVDHTTKYGECAPVKPLPPGASKVAVFICTYKDYSIGTKRLTGIHSFTSKLLEKLDYRTVYVPYYEYNIKEKTLKNVQYLQSKLREVVSL